MRTMKWKTRGSKRELYDCTVKVIDEEKLICWIDCTCWNFINRRLKAVGQFSDIKVFAEPCKHLKLIVEALEKQGYRLKQQKKENGSDSPSRTLKNALFERARNKCENPHCQNTDFLTIHRIIRGGNGGKYNMENCEVLCTECHRNRHYGEFL